MLSLRPQLGGGLLVIESWGDHDVLGFQQTIIESVMKLEWTLK